MDLFDTYFKAHLQSDADVQISRCSTIIEILVLESFNMGSMCATFKANEDIPGQGKKALEVAAALSYGSHEINNLYRNFVYMDQDKSGQVICL